MKSIKIFVQDLIDLGFDLKQVKAALEDGAWLASTGISQEEAEAAYASVCVRIAKQAKVKTN